MNISQIIKNNKRSIVLLAVVKSSENNQSQISIRGTGFIISENGKFITNAHVWEQIPEEDREFLEVKVPGEENDKKLMRYDNYKVELVELDKENDVALLKIKEENKEFNFISSFGDSEAVEEGEEVVFIGYPLATELLGMGFGITMNTNKCIVSSIKRRGKDGSLHFFMVDSHINNGSSGSPIFSGEGKLIGVVSGRIGSKVPFNESKVLDIPANLGICRPFKYAKDLIDKN